MKSNKIILLALISSLLVSSCDWHGTKTVVGTGDVDTLRVVVENFTGVSVTGECNVDIRIGETQEVKLSAQSEVLDVMTYEVKNKVLQIGFKSGTSVNASEEISADIVIPAASYLAVTGAGNFYLKGSKQDYLHIYITGSGNVSAYDMEVNDCLIQITGAGNCEVNVSNSMDIQISGVGNIFYKGSPTITSEISGVGNVSAEGD